MGDDHPFTLQLQICALDRNDTHANCRRQLPYGWEGMARRPIADRNALTDVPHDLEIHRPLVALRDHEHIGTVDTLARKATPYIHESPL